MKYRVTFVVEFHSQYEHHSAGSAISQAHAIMTNPPITGAAVPTITVEREVVKWEKIEGPTTNA